MRHEIDPVTEVRQRHARLRIDLTTAVENAVTTLATDGDPADSA